MSADLLVFWFAEPAEGAISHPIGLFNDTDFWVGLGFLVFVGLIGRQAWMALAGALDRRAERISSQIEEARSLREEAQRRLADIERRNKEALKDAEEIERQARDSAAEILKRADADAEAMVERRTEQMDARIAQMEAQAIAHVRWVAAEAAAAAARQVLRDAMQGDAGTRMIDKAIEEVGQRLH
ncbi:MAG: F0F1 ATP synthase subunit B [Rhodothalassiaceae bacterium]